MTDITTRKYLMVRAMKSSQESLNLFFERSVVAVGWSRVNFSLYHNDEITNLSEAVKNEYYKSENVLPQIISKSLNRVKRFQKISAGDYILIPFNSSVRLAVAEDDVYFDEDSVKYDLANQRKVSYQKSGNSYKTIPRGTLSEALQRRLRVRGSTVSDLYEFKDEIEKLFNQDSYSWASDFEEREFQRKETLKVEIIKRIRSGQTNLQTGGLGLEHLVSELFTCEGYVSEVLSKQKFESGDADVSATKSDKFQETKFLVQVKHHQGNTNDWGINQLNKIKETGGHEDCKFLLVTSGDISDSVEEIARHSDIVLMDGTELSEWIVENLNNLSVETKIRLGISAFPQIFS